jgi:hypothetical protein
MDYYEAFQFDEFRLEVGRDAAGRKVLTLYHDNGVVPDVLNPSLELLHFMVQHPKEELREHTILKKLWPGSGPNILQKHIHFLRTALKDDPKDPRYIKTVYEHGYQFMANVKREGGGIDAYPKWDRARFYELIRDLKRGPVTDEEDLRIVATGIGATLDELDLRGLLRKRLRIKILVMNPENEALTDARYTLRLDKVPARCLRELHEQITDIRKFADEYPPDPNLNRNRVNNPRDIRGSLEFGVSDIMPCGFLVHAREWAILGVYPAQDSYLAAPMLEMRAGSEPWEVLYADFKARWSHFLASPNGPAQTGF